MRVEIWMVWMTGRKTNAVYQMSDGIRTAAANRNCGRDTILPIRARVVTGVN